MQISKRGLELIKGIEDLRLVAYDDGGGVQTIGYGHTHDVRPGDRITPEEAEQYLRQDVLTAERIINRRVSVPLSQNQFDALVSFAFNIGEGQFAGSDLRRKLNASDYEGAAREFGRWIYDNGEVVNGLVWRRFQEWRMFAE